jgi:hypothetical protein
MSTHTEVLQERDVVGDVERSFFFFVETRIWSKKGSIPSSSIALSMSPQIEHSHEVKVRHCYALLRHDVDGRA